MKFFQKLKSALGHTQSPPDLASDYLDEYADFKNLYPEYNQGYSLTELRESEFNRLDEEAHIYLDFANHALHAPSHLQAYVEFLNSHLLDSPQGKGPASSYMEKLATECKQEILKYFNTSENDYLCLFTPHTEHIVNYIAKTFPFQTNSQLLLTLDNQKVMEQLRDTALKNNASVQYGTINSVDLRINERQFINVLDQGTSDSQKLLVYPAQSNFTGVMHGLEWVNIAQSKDWNVLLDATHYLSTQSLDLKSYPADFVLFSPEKIVGYPVHISILLIKKATLKRLRPQPNWLIKDDDYQLQDSYQLNYLEIPAIKLGLDWINLLGYPLIHDRIKALTSWMLDSFQALRHQSGQKLIKIYGPKNTAKRGGTILLNILDEDGNSFEAAVIQKLARNLNITIHAGEDENPGISALISGKIPAYTEVDKEQPILTNTLRISFGYISNFDDAYRFVSFCKRFLNKKADDSIKKLQISPNSEERLEHNENHVITNK